MYGLSATVRYWVLSCLLAAELSVELLPRISIRLPRSRRRRCALYSSKSRAMTTMDTTMETAITGVRIDAGSPVEADTPVASGVDEVPGEREGMSAIVEVGLVTALPMAILVDESSSLALVS